MPKQSTTEEVGRAITAMMKDYHLTVQAAMKGTGRGQSTVWAWMHRGTSDLQAIAALEDLCGAPRGEVLRRCDGPDGRPYFELPLTTEQAIEHDDRLLPHLRRVMVETFQNCVRLSDEARRGGGSEHISRAS